MPRYTAAGCFMHLHAPNAPNNAPLYLVLAILYALLELNAAHR